MSALDRLEDFIQEGCSARPEDKHAALLDLEATRSLLSRLSNIVHSTRCSKCNGNGRDVPCAYPDFNYRDCGHPFQTALRWLSAQ